MKKAIKIALGLVVVLCVAYWALAIALRINHEQVYGQREKSDLARLGRTIQELGETNRLTPEVLNRIGDATELTDLVAPHHELGKLSMVDLLGKQYSVEKRETGDQIYLRIHSSYELPRTW